MAVSLSSFSIREYASKMRSVDAAKCWPFGGEMTREDVDAGLPPITVTKFRWWADELEALRPAPAAADQENKKNNDTSADNVEQAATAPDPQDRVCPVCSASSAPTADATNAHVDGCLVHASKAERRRIRMAAAARKAKARVPKKRSIVEIFEVSRQIEAMNVDEEDGDDPTAEAKSKNKKKKKKQQQHHHQLMKKKKADCAKMMNKIKKEKLIKLIKNKSTKTIATCSEKIKEQSPTLKLQSSVNFTRELNVSICDKRAEKDLSAVFGIHKKKPSIKCLSVQKKHKVLMSKLIKTHHKLASPPSAILKNHKNVTLGKKSLIMRKVQGVSNVNYCGNGNQKSSRHVRFSGDVNTFDPRKKQFSSLACPESNHLLFSDAIAASSTKTKQVEGSREPTSREVYVSDEDMSVNPGGDTETGTQLPLVEKKQFPVGNDVDVTTHFLPLHNRSPENINHDRDESVSLSQAIPSGDDVLVFDQEKTAAHKPPNVEISQVPAVPREDNIPYVNTQICGFIPAVSNISGSTVDYFGDPTPKIAPMNLIAKMKAFPHSPSSCFATNQKANQRPPFLSQITAETCNACALQQQPSRYPFSEELIGSTGSFPDWEKRTALFGERCIKEDFFGLPLNSQGELIQLYSSDRVGFDQQLKRPNMVAISSSNLSVLNGSANWSTLKEKNFGQLDFPSMQNYVNGSTHFNASSQFGAAEVQGTDRTNFLWLDSISGKKHSPCPPDSELHLTNISCYGTRQFDHVNNKGETLMTHSDPLLQPATQPTLRLMGKDVTVGKNNKEFQVSEDGKVWTDKEIIVEHTPKTTGPGSFLARRQFQHDWILHPTLGQLNGPIGFSTDIQNNQASKRHTDTEFLHLQPYLNRQTNRVSPNVYRSTSNNLNFSSQTFVHPPPPLQFNRAPIMQEPFISSSESFIFDSSRPFPVADPLNMCQHKQALPNSTKSADCSELAHTSSIPRSSKGLPPWLLHTTQQKEKAMYSHPYSHLAGKFHSSNMSENNFLKIPSVHHSSSAASYPCNPMMSQPHSQSSQGPISFARSPLIPIFSESIPAAAVSMNYQNKSKGKDKMKPNPLWVKVPERRNKTKKRPPFKATSTKATQITNFDMQARGKFANLSEFDSNRDNAVTVEWDLNENQKNGHSCLPGIDPLKVEGVTRSGPIKLSAGTKHILKPIQNMDQDNSKPTYSTIPIAAVMSTGSINKSAKIYRF